MGDADLVADAKNLIDTIAATPRFAGSAEEARARELCAAELRKLGLDVGEEKFGFSEWPGRWGIPLIAATLVLAVTLFAVEMRYRAYAPVSFLFLFGGLIFGRKNRERATERLPWHRNTSANLQATRGTPRAWLVAHLDSKSQTVPMLGRVVSHVMLFAILAIAIVLVVMQAGGAIHWAPWRLLSIAAFVAALPSLFCFVGNRSDGALDNATGVAAVLLAARLVPKHIPFGVVLTSGEELDLAGARAWRHGLPLKTAMINCDTIDDSGAWRCMYASRPQAAVVCAERAAARLGVSLRVGRIIPGILTDSIAFTAAGLPSVTISRGTLSTLARLHTAGDTSNRITGTGAATAARLLAGIIEEIG